MGIYNRRSTRLDPPTSTVVVDLSEQGLDDLVLRSLTSKTSQSLMKWDNQKIVPRKISLRGDFEATSLCRSFPGRGRQDCLEGQYFSQVLYHLSPTPPVKEGC